jgi:hypothetical protein
MSGAGYGRGFYGSEQLARPRTGGGANKGWFKIAAVAGLGAAIYWWVLPAIRPKPKQVTAPYASPPPVEASYSPPHASSLHDEDLERHARSRGFPSAKAYADAMIAMVDELRAAGAKVELAPHFPPPPRSEGV